MTTPAINKDTFFRRIRQLYAAWNKGTAEEVASLRRCSAIVAYVGKDQEDQQIFTKTGTMQTWLFGYELHDFILVLTKKSILILTSKKKIEFLKSIESSKENEEGVPPVTLLVRERADKDAANFERLLGALNTGATVGVFAKDQAEGEFTDDWKARLDGKKLETVDISVALVYLTATKDESEVALISKSAQLTDDLYGNFFCREIERICVSERKIKHSKLAKLVENAINNAKYIKPADSNWLDACYEPIIQSGGNYSLKFSITSDENTLHFGVVTCSLGFRYKSYCSNLIRTLLFNPTEEQKRLYEFLLEVQEAVLDRLRADVRLADVYRAAVEKVEQYDKRLLEKFTPTVGFGMGIEFRESLFVLAPKSKQVARKNMIFNVALGFTGLENKEAADKEGRTYALFIGDTVQVNGPDAPATCLSTYKKKVKNVSMMIQDPEEEEEEEEGEEDDDDADEAGPSSGGGSKKKKKTNGVSAVEEVMKDAYGRGRRTAVVEKKLRSEPTTEDKRKSHQKELAESLNETARARLAEKASGNVEARSRKSNVSYKSPSQMPSAVEIGELKIFVDKKYETIILPIFGLPVPFHISTIKNISQSIEGDYTYLRINFFTPGTTISKAEAALFSSNADSTFLKELTYRSTNLKEAGEISAPSTNLNTAFRLIKEVQKRYKTREAEEREKEGIVKQDNLVLANSKTNPKLKDLYIRPNIITKRIHGTLEAHQNGFRFTSIRSDKIDIMYNNIKHAFFQPCDKEMLILLHFNLKNPIMFGKKKQTDVQFYTEVGEITTDLGKHQNMHDRDDLASEQAEREMRQKLKAAFKLFCDKVEQMTNQAVEFDTPFRDLAFFGVPNRSNVLLQPTSGCLVNLTDWPPFVISLEDVELVHFERVQFQLKNFDMVFIFKDYHRKTSMVTSIPMNMLDHVKEWLNSCDIRYTEGIQSLNWAKVMKTITDDPEEFFDNGGWKFLDPNSGDEGEEDEEEDEEDDYNPSASEGEEVDDESESDFSEDSDASEGDESEENSLASSEESGKDWSELEEEAAKADRNHNDFVDDYTRNKRKVLGPRSEKDERKRRADDHHHRSKHGHSSGGGGSSNKKMRKH